MASREPTIVITSKHEKWRLECPEGHKDWRVWNGVFCCQTCKRHRDASEAQESVYDHLQDTKTGEAVTRDRLTYPDRPRFRIDIGQPVGAD